jgi:O-antigen ligase
MSCGLNDTHVQGCLVNKFKFTPLWICFFVLEVLLGAAVAIFSEEKKTLLILALFFISWGIILRKFRFGIYLLAILVPLDSQAFYFHTNWSTFTDIVPAFVPVGLITFLSFLLHKGARLDPKPQSGDAISNLHTLLALLVIWSAMSLIWTPNIYKGMIQEVRFVTNLFLVMMVLSGLDNEGTYKKVVKIFIFTGIVMAIAALASLVIELRHVTRLWRVDVTDQMRLVVNFYTHEYHAMGLHAHNALGTIFNIMIALSIGMLLSTHKKGIRLFYSMVILLFLTAHLLTRSRGALVGLFAMVPFFLIVIPPFKRHLLKCTVLFLFIFSVLFVITLPRDASKGVSRYTVSKSSESSLSFRLKWWENGLKYTFGQTVGVGMGVGGFKQRFSEKIKQPPLPHAHSFYLSALFDFGVIGFLLLLLLLFAIGKKCYDSMKGFQMNFQSIMLCSCIAGLIATGIHALIDAEYNTGLPWFLLGMTVAAIKLVNQRKNIPSQRCSCINGHD